MRISTAGSILPYISSTNTTQGAQMAYSSTDLLRDTMRAAGNLPALEAKAEELADAMLRARQETSHD